VLKKHLNFLKILPMQNNTNRNLKILFSPLHYVITNNSGSEFIWSFNLYKYLGNHFYKSLFVTGGTNIKSKQIINLNIFNPDKIDLKLSNVIIYHITSQLVSLKYLFKSRVLFHVLPFSIGNSINLLFFIPFIKIYKVIGPIQLPLTVTDSDIDVSDARGFGTKKNNFEILAKLLLAIKPIISLINKKMMQRADKLIVISSLVKDRLVSEGINKDKIEVIPVGLDIEPYNNNQTSKNKVYTIISTSYFVKRKNIDQIIKAVKKVKDKKIDVKLLLVGDGPQKENLIKLTSELGLNNFVNFVGFIPNSKIIDYYKKSHCFVSMSSSESWGQVYLEAMASGLPCISSINNGSKVIIDENKNGYLVNQNDVDDLSHKIIKLVKDENLYNSFSKEAVKKVKDNYDWKTVIIPKYIKLIESIN